MIKNFAIAVTIFSSIWVIPASANAATEIVEGNIAGDLADGTPLGVSQFDDSLGTLTSVTVAYNLTSDFSGQYDNTSGYNALGSFFVGDGTAYLDDASGTQLVSGTFHSNSGFITLLTGINNFNYIADGLNGTLAPYIDSTALTAFTGAGEYYFSVGGIQSEGVPTFPVIGVELLNSSISTTDSVSVTYTYTPATFGVPEPATWALMLTGFGMVGYAMRKSVRTTIACG